MDEKKTSSGLSWLKVMAIVIGTVILTLAVSFYFARTWFFPQPFTPVTLSTAETKQLDVKLARLEEVEHLPAIAAPQNKGRYDNERMRENSTGQQSVSPASQEDQEARPERYDESNMSREIHFTERELNGLIAGNTDMGQRLAIDLSKDLVSANLLIALPPDSPIMAGRTVRIRAGLELAFRNSRPVVKLRGISIMGVPLPNAWMGQLKNIELVEQFGNDQGFWQAFADGVETVNVQDGALRIQLKE